MTPTDHVSMCVCVCTCMHVCVCSTCCRDSSAPHAAAAVFRLEDMSQVVSVHWCMLLSWHAYMYVSVYVRICMCMYGCVRMFVCIYFYVNVCDSCIDARCQAVRKKHLFHRVTVIVLFVCMCVPLSIVFQGILPSTDDDVNIARFHPFSGYGLLYGTKQVR